jgi:hypothetical protein
MEAKGPVTFQHKGRQLEATLSRDGFDWELWVGLNKKNDVVVRQRFHDQPKIVEHEVTAPKSFVDYESLLLSFVDSRTTK